MTGTKSLNTELRVRAGLRVLLALMLVAPYLIWLGRVREWTWPATEEWLPLALVSTGQAFWSSAFAMLFGFFLFAGAQAWLTPRAKRVCEFVLLFPNMIPPLFLVLALLSWITPFAAFPYGVGAVIVAHVMMNAGLVAVALDRLVQAKVGGMAETAWTLGATRSLFWRKIAWPSLRADLACLMLFVFSICFTSFSIPLVLGGSKQATLEVGVFDVIRTEGAWDKAVILAAMQSLFLLALAIALPRPFWPPRPRRLALEFLALPRLRWMVAAPAVILLGGWLAGFKDIGGVAAMEGLPIVEAVLTSLALGVSVGLLHLLLFLLVAYVTPHEGLYRFLNGYLAPSSAITGFSMLLLPGAGDLFSFLKLTLALTMISFPLLYRWVVHAALAEVSGQMSVARSLGASWSLVLLQIIWPQVAPQLLRASGLAALWGACDFAVSSIVAGELNTLPLLMAGLMGNYRIEAAEVLMFPLLIAGLALYALFTGAESYVTR